MTRSRDTANIIPTVDAKGDLLVGTANNEIDNLTAGTNGTYLKANSSATTGLEWGNPVPVGGTEGQVLAKASGTNYDSEWVTVTVDPTPQIFLLMGS
jgi:hypothetical protein